MIKDIVDFLGFLGNFLGFLRKSAGLDWIGLEWIGLVFDNVYVQVQVVTIRIFDRSSTPSNPIQSNPIHRLHLHLHLHINIIKGLVF